MANIFQKAKSVLVAALDSDRSAEKTELAYLRELYAPGNGGPPRRNQWYQIISSGGGNVVGYSFACACGTEYQMLSVDDWFGKAHVCPTCKTEFDLFRAAGIAAEDGDQQKREKLAKLPVRPRNADIKRSPFVDTWQQDSDETVQWAGSKPVSTVPYV